MKRIKSDSIICPVIHIVDGDTIKIRYMGQLESIRLLRINTPEREQDGYHEASNALKCLVENREVILEFERQGWEERDHYGRVLAYVLFNHINVNVHMVRKGWYMFWRRDGDGRLCYLFEEAEREARASDNGLWTSRGWNR